MRLRRDTRWVARSSAAAAYCRSLTLVKNVEQLKQRKVSNDKWFALGGREIASPEELQELLWKRFFADASQWWDRRWTKPSPLHPDFTHRDFKFRLWLNNRHKPAWVDSQLASMDAGLKTTGLASVQWPGAVTATEAHLEFQVCRILCVDGPVADAVDALDLLVQQGRHVPRDLFYRVLKRCIKVKDLTSGRRIHSLTVSSGYDGDAFLATHLIGLYASHGMLEEAMQVFTKVCTPSAHNWATIIFTYAKHGSAAAAAVAVKLYRKMCGSTTVTFDDRLYSAILKACAAAKDLVAGKEVHAHILASPGRPDRFVQSGLVSMYAKCGSLRDAREVFDELSYKNVVMWNAMIAGYAQQAMGQEALGLYRNMQQEGFAPDSVTYACVLQACASVGVGALDKGRQLHAEIKQRGLQEGSILGTSLVNMYAKCGDLDAARSVFDMLPERNVVAWNAMIAGYAKQGPGQEAFVLYRSMQQDGLTAPDFVTFVCLLQACASIGGGGLVEGKQLHVEIRKHKLQENVVVGGSLVNMYAKCGSLENARSLFDKLPERNVVAWNAMIAGYAQQGMGHEAFGLYSSMQLEGLIPDCFTYVALLQACALSGAGALEQGKQLHADIEKQALQDGLVLGSSLVNMYAKCGSIDSARKLFDKLVEKNIVAWNAMIAGYAQQGLGEEALKVYRTMQLEDRTRPDSVTYVSLLQSCANIGVGALDDGKKLHARIRERGLQEDVVLGGSLVNMYAKCGSLDNAQIVFDKLSSKGIVTWTALIAGYAHRGVGREALSLYRRMQQEGLTPNPVTYVCLLQACASVGVEALVEGKQLHVQIEERGLANDAVLGGSLVNMYAKCGQLEEARIVFDKLSERGVVTWTAMIAGYAQQGMGQDALCLYSLMQQEGLLSDSVTYVCLLQACAAVAALPLGEKLHAEIRARKIQVDGMVGAALVNMYAKCGSMYDAHRIFASLPGRTIEAWDALVGGYARQGDSEVVFDLLDRMKMECVHPSEITFVSVLTVCSHAGLVDKGRAYFKAMRTEYGISATMEHYICMVDLLGRAGHLDEALQVAKTMPVSPDGVVWRTLLGACRKWKNVKIGQQAFQGALGVDEKDAASYVLMSNIYGSIQMWEAAKRMQARRLKLGAWKKPGQSSWTDFRGVVHTFVVGDSKHPESDGIYARLEKLILRIKKEGYVPQLDSSLVDLPDDAKESELCGHSEKLAIAYALNRTPDGTTIRIVKNLRVCEDCHTATALISRVEKRAIICRDASRFHVFEGGKCSCGDYW